MKGLEKIIDKYCDYTSGIRGQKKKAILIQLSSIINDESSQFKKDKEDIGNVLVGILDSLLAAKMVGLAGRLLYVCQEQLKVCRISTNQYHSCIKPFIYNYVTLIMN